MINRALNVFIRVSVLVLKFLFLFFVAKFLDTKDIGEYGIIASVVLYGSLLVGLEFYNYSIREISNFAELVNKCLSVISLYLIVYAAAFLGLYFLFHLGVLDFKYFYVVYFLIVLEHLSLEISRMLIAFHKQVESSIVVMLKSGLWAAVVMLTLWSGWAWSVKGILNAWLVSLFISTVYGAWALFREEGTWEWIKPDFKWVRAGLPVAFLFFISAITFRFVFVSDRYFISIIYDDNILASYVIYIGMANAIYTVVDASVFSYSLPRILEVYRVHNIKLFFNLIDRLILITLGVTGVLCATAFWLSSYVVEWIGKQVYVDNMGMLIPLLISVFFWCWSMVYHFALYAIGSDKSITIANFMSLFSFVFSVSFFYLNEFPLIVQNSILASMFSLCLIKMYFYQRCVIELKD